MTSRDPPEVISIIRIPNPWVSGSYHPIPSLDEARNSSFFLSSSRDGMGCYEPRILSLVILTFDMASGLTTDSYNKILTLKNERLTFYLERVILETV